ncbi:MAG: diguanylate cyclase, partial [Burkholderiales bacterium]|nr:diguanylate cyclase [Burkholderiales bacterium]
GEKFDVTGLLPKNISRQDTTVVDPEHSQSFYNGLDFFTANDQRLFITFSAGVALRNSREPQEETIKRADKAMYEAKQSGKNRVIKAA